VRQAADAKKMSAPVFGSGATASQRAASPTPTSGSSSGERLRDVVKFRWKMVSTKDGAVAGLGLEFLVIDAEGRIRSDYQFIES
jgi:hypothetical protein